MELPFSARQWRLRTLPLQSGRGEFIGTRRSHRFPQGGFRPDGIARSWAAARVTPGGSVASRGIDALPRRPARPLEVFARDQPGPRPRAPGLLGGAQGHRRGRHRRLHAIRRGSRRSGDKLVPAEPGLFRLRDDIEQAIAAKLPAACRAPVRFMLEVEISTIYKKGDTHPEGPPSDLRARLRDRRAHLRARSRASATSPPTAGRSSGSTRATCWRSRSSRRPTPIWCRRTSGRRGSRRSARSRASIRSPNATATSRRTSSRSRPGCRPIRR